MRRAPRMVGLALVAGMLLATLIFGHDPVAYADDSPTPTPTPTQTGGGSGTDGTGGGGHVGS